jgi:Reverse transcriptase (RNA-dependent DNA polymerase)
MEMEEDNQVPIILGRPFLVTVGTNLDMKNDILSLAIGDEKIEFNVTKSMKYPSNDDVCCRVEAMDTLAAEIFNMQINMEEEKVLGEATKLLEKLNELTAKSLTESFDSAGDGEEKAEGKTPQLELKSLPPNLRYEFLDLNKAYPVIVGAHLDATQTAKLLHELRLQKKAIGYSIENLKGLNPSLCMHRILLEEDHKPSREPQKRLNPNLREVVKKEVIKLLNADIIYPISDSERVSMVQVVPKKRGMTVVKNENNELLPTRLVTEWRMCIDYRRLNKATRKDHFSLPFIDQLLERLAKHSYFCYLDGYSSFFQIPIHPQDQEKTTFTCPYGTFAYRRMPFGLCNAPGTFQRTMMAIFLISLKISWRYLWMIFQSMVSLLMIV